MWGRFCQEKIIIDLPFSLAHIYEGDKQKAAGSNVLSFFCWRDVGTQAIPLPQTVSCQVFGGNLIDSLQICTKFENIFKHARSADECGFNIP